MTHKEINDPRLRKLFATELFALRRAMRGIEPMNSEYVFGIRVGIDTILRRMCDKKYMELFNDNHPAGI